MSELAGIRAIALDLTRSLGSEDRHQRFLDALAAAIPSDASCLLRLDGDELRPVAQRGLVPEVAGQRFRLIDHPRLAAICAAADPVRFPAGSKLPDPFDGLVAGDAIDVEHIHACMGCALRVDEELVGALTFDALDPRAFDDLDPVYLATLGALAAAMMWTSALIEALEKRASKEGMLARELMRDDRRRATEELLGTSTAMAKLRRDIELVASTDLPVLVTGETGTGKELIARALHAASARSDRAMIRVNCAALPDSMAESELFGHLRGSFTGADQDRAGKFTIADGGTLFLDEIGELPLALQPKLLRAIQEGEIQRIGEDRAARVDVRIVAATNRDLAVEVAAGRFREDLYHRLAVYPLRAPALSERRSDIPLLIGHFVESARRRFGLAEVRIDPILRDQLQKAPWSGNVRELENTITRLVLEASAGRGAKARVRLSAGARSPGIGEEVAAETIADPTAEEGFDLRQAVRDYQRRLIRRAVAETGGNWAAAARRLGLDRGNLFHLAKRLGLR